MIELNVIEGNPLELNISGSDPVELDVVMPTGGGGEPTLQTKSVTYTPTESEQTDSVTPDAGYDGLSKVDVTVEAIDSEYIGSDVPRKSSSDLTESGATVTAPAGYYSASATKSVASGTEGTPTATKGAVSNHSVSVTPSVTNSAGYINGGTKTGSAVSVSASELVSGTKSISANGTEDVTNYASVNVSVPNSYSASDEGKVVDNGALVAQTSATYTENDTYDTTKINSVTVNVSGGGGGTDYLDLIERTQTSISNSDVITIGKSAFRDYTTLTSVDFPNCTSLGDGCFNGCSNLASFNLPKVTTIVSGNTFSSCIGKLALPSLTTYPNLNAINNYKGTEIDLGTGVAEIKSYMFNSDSNLNVIVLRYTSVAPLASINAFNSTKFANNGAGGTIYIPKSLYDHLGDNSSLDYKHASNWSTVDGYGTITWAKIEGSYYETHYADGTLIPT